MPDLGQWLILLLVLGAGAAFVFRPLAGAPDREAAGGDRQGLRVRHRLAIESLRDLEADRRAGSLDDASYAAQRAEAEERAVRTLEQLEAAPAPGGEREMAEAAPARAAQRAAAWIGAVVVGLVLVAFALPGPVGLGERTRTNDALAQQLATEEARQQRIGELTRVVAGDPRDAATLSELADLFLAGGSAQDLQGAAATLLLLRDAAPRDRSAHERLITTYIRAGDWADAAAATDTYADVAGPMEPDIPFFRGLIALRGDGNAAKAIAQFDRFLRLAPDDPRAPMVRGLRSEAATE